MNDVVSGRNPQLPHFVVVPLMSHGHMIPMTDLALLLASRGPRVSLITTPVNARRLRAAADHATASGLPLELVELPFPCKSVGLPEGCENLDLIPRSDLVDPFFKSLSSMAAPLKSYLRAQPPAPTCIISDQCMPWTMEVASDLNIPRLIFHCTSCFYILCFSKLVAHKFYAKITNKNEIFAVPELPQRIEVCKHAAQSFFHRPEMEDVKHRMDEADATADGIVLNTFGELEQWYINEYRRSIEKKVWAVGPVSLFHKDSGGIAVRGNGAAAADLSSPVFRWLQGKAKRSVLYICFGSIARTTTRQLMEIGRGVEDSGMGFLWAVKEAEKNDEVSKWLAEFEQRNQSRGMILKGWVPQVLILNHPAVGGFMTHCGWNSTLEALAAGLPMLTWPHFFDQFLNEKLVVEVLGTGVEVVAKLPSTEDVVVGREKVEAAVRKVMSEGAAIHRAAAELGQKARKAMEEGGSSYESLSDLIHHAMKLAETRAVGTQ